MKNNLTEADADLLRVLKNTAKALEYSIQFMGDDLLLEKCKATLAAAKHKIDEHKT